MTLRFAFQHCTEPYSHASFLHTCNVCQKCTNDIGLHFPFSFSHSNYTYKLQCSRLPPCVHTHTYTCSYRYSAYLHTVLYCWCLWNYSLLFQFQLGVIWGQEKIKSIIQQVLGCQGKGSRIIFQCLRFSAASRIHQLLLFMEVKSCWGIKSLNCQ